MTIKTTTSMKERIANGESLFEYCLNRYKESEKHYCNHFGGQYREPNAKRSGFMIVQDFGPIFIACNKHKVIGVLAYDCRSHEYEPIDFETDSSGNLILTSLCWFA